MRLKRQYIPHVLIALALVASTACAGNKKPDTQVAGTTADVVAALTEFQHLVTQSTDAGVLPVDKAKQLTTLVETASTKGKEVSTALKAYHLATGLADAQSKASTVQALLVQLNEPIGKLLGISFPDSIASNASKLIGNVLLAISAVQTEVAKGLGGGTV